MPQHWESFWKTRWEHSKSSIFKSRRTKILKGLSFDCVNITEGNVHMFPPGRTFGVGAQLGTADVAARAIIRHWIVQSRLRRRDISHQRIYWVQVHHVIAALCSRKKQTPENNKYLNKKYEKKKLIQNKTLRVCEGRGHPGGSGPVGDSVDT